MLEIVNVCNILRQLSAPNSNTKKRQQERQHEKENAHKNRAKFIHFVFITILRCTLHSIILRLTCQT